MAQDKPSGHIYWTHLTELIILQTQAVGELKREIEDLKEKLEREIK